MNLLTNVEADALLYMPKRIVVNDEMKDEFMFSFADKIKGRYKMRSLDGNFTFLMQITQSKLNIKISLYLQESSRPIGLFRVDYNASDHKNPVISNEHVPDYVKPYTNKHIYGGHVHMYVQGYKPLAWAVPIDSHDFSIKEMTGINSFYAAIDEFCDIISLQTTIQHDGRMFL